MYLPAHFEETRPEVLHQLIARHPFGLLVTPGADGHAVANSIPFVFEPATAGGAGVLKAHVSRANPVWRETPADAHALVVFQGEQGYVSPGWYPSKQAHGKVVPTWNYVLVQARGTLRIRDDREWVRRLVTRLTERHEAALPAPWAVTDAPTDYLETMLAAIVGIEVELTALSGKWKLSQNRSAADRGGVVEGLGSIADDASRALARRVADPADGG